MTRGFSLLLMSASTTSLVAMVIIRCTQGGPVTLFGTHLQQSRRINGIFTRSFQLPYYQSLYLLLYQPSANCFLHSFPRSCVRRRGVVFGQFCLFVSTITVKTIVMNHSQQIVNVSGIISFNFGEKTGLKFISLEQKSRRTGNATQRMWINWVEDVVLGSACFFLLQTP